ncbi:MAG: sphingosine kinase [Acidimicrobiia bacterium]|nr:sphingosine kinase [Acidimicrobiia bacterium]
MEVVHLLVNRSAAAGRAARSVGAITAHLGTSGREVRVLAAASKAEARAAAAVAVADGAGRIVVAGGDGLVHDVLPALVGSGTVLGVVPVGSGNDFARALGVVGLDVAEACAVALGPARRFDAARSIAGGWVASIATAGFSGQVTARAAGLRFPPGRARYTTATLIELPRLWRRWWRIVVDGEVHEVEAVLVAVANTAFFGGGMAICPGADPADGQLDVGVVGGVGRAQLMRFFPLVFSGAHVDHPAFETYRGAKVRLEAPEGVEVWADGEPFGAVPLELEAVPGALLVAAAT